MATEHIDVTTSYEIIDDFENLSFANGGAIRITAGTLTSDGEAHTFSGNSATNQYGGAIWADGANTSVTISNITFTENTSAASNNKGGGAIGVSGSAKGTLTNCIFDGNTAARGGALFFGSGTLTVDSCQFLTASDTIYIKDSSAKLTFTGTITLAASINEPDKATTAAYVMLDGATLNFTNTEDISIVKLKKVDSVSDTGDSANTLVFNGVALVNFAATNNSKPCQNLNGFTLAYGGDKEDILDLHNGLNFKKVATGVNVYTDKVSTYDDDNMIVGYFAVDGKKDLYYNYTDYLKVEYGTSDALAAADTLTFASLEKLYAQAGEFRGAILSTVDEGYTVGTTSKAKSIRGAYQYAAEIGVVVNGTVTGMVMGYYGGDVALDPVDDIIEATTVEIGETGVVNKEVIGGAYVKGGEANIYDSYLYLAGTLKGHSFGGSYVIDGQSSTVGIATTEIDGASIAEDKYVIAGGFASGANALSDMAITDLIVKSDVNGQVFGGGWAQKGATSNVDVARITLHEGLVDTVFAGGTFASNSSSIATVGEAKITLQGGNANTIYLNGKGTGSVIDGTVSLYVNAAASVDWIEGLTSNGVGGATDTNLYVNKALTTGKIAHVDNWIFDKEGSINYKGTLNFKQKYVRNGETVEFDQPIKLSVGDDYIGDGALITSTNKIVNFNDTYVEVELFGTAATYNEATGVFVADGNSLALSSDKKSLILTLAS